MNTSLKGKVALVTGGTSGIGEAAALALAREGAKVVVAGRRESEGQAVVDAIQKAGGEAFFVKTDVSRETDVKALVDQTMAKFGRLDFAFNNAGVRVNAIAFGTIDTPMVDRLVGESKTSNSQREWLVGLHPIGRVGTVEEAAQAVLALMQNPFITGAVLAVDGGWTAQ